MQAAAARVRRSKSFLVAEAIEQYLAVQEWQISAIRRGLEAADRGALVPYDQVKAGQIDGGRSPTIPASQI